MNAKEKYELINDYKKGNITKERLILKLSLSKRQVDRLISEFDPINPNCYEHGNKGKAPVNTIAQETKDLIVDLYRIKYFDSNFEFFSELLLEHEKIGLSPTTVRTALMKENIISPRATRETKREMKKKLKQKLETTNISLKEKEKIEKAIIDIENSHSRRPRCAYFGEMIQLDASLHLWFGDSKAQLHIAVDDSTGKIVGAYFDKEETLKGYYNVFSQILLQHGIPYMFFTDKRTVFEYNKKKTSDLDKDTFTQFGYACKQLGVKIETSSVPQAKGRVERMFQTLQGRLPIELRLAGISNIEAANEFLNHYVKKFNAQFSLPSNNIKSVFEKQLSQEEINIYLSVLTKRSVDSGHSIRFENKYFKVMDENNKQICFRRNTPALLIRSFDGNLYVNIFDKLFILEEIPLRERRSKNFDVLPIDTENNAKMHIPSVNSTWNQEKFDKFVSIQIHRTEKVA